MVAAAPWALVELGDALRAAGLPVPEEATTGGGGGPGSRPMPMLVTPTPTPTHSALDWAESGLMALTGQPGRPPVVPAAPVLDRARAAAQLLTAVSTRLGSPVFADVAEILGGRAALLGLRRGGTVSANGSCRLMRAADGWVAVNLARPDDVDAVPALLGAEITDDVWDALAAALPRWRSRDLVERAWLLGLPVAPLPAAAAAGAGAGGAGAGGADAGGLDPGSGFAVVRVSGGATGRRPAPPGPPESPGPTSAPAPLVVDLSSLWAGPLAARLLGQLGLRVIKVESVHRPDGARRGDPDFYRWLHTGQDETRFDFHEPAGRAALRDLVEQADVVIEGSRPRALAQLGLDAQAWVAARPGRVWLSITGYGRRVAAQADGAGPVAFGDDAAVGGGLVAWDQAARGGPVPVFCGDAIADPLAGLFGALAVALCRAGGRGALVDVAMRDVAAFVAGPRSGVRGGGGGSRGRGAHEQGEPPWAVTGSDELGWTVHQAGQEAPVRAPRPPQLRG
ncbi:CoA-transferase family III [Parafrankia irregularis]|uniref:CoA-transferase family III n=1 Tax=Parafrankia irregularis TaxID=795642 RepID=A0A0S4QE08_9ACTN|nr:CoA transferase [Parafrankia irregularis]CUU53534.1 CoA-transferase family III [Parafrankia irregularis]